jgi:cytochrome c oxidase cbb3-type subunit 1
MTSADIKSDTKAASLEEINDSARLPLVVLFVSAAQWLVLGSVLNLLAAIKLHTPHFLGSAAWLTYGRLRPAANDAFLYGFCIQAGLGVSLWLLARLGGTRFVQPILALVGAKLWNLGLTLGMIGIFIGDATGFENFEMPRYAALFLFLGFAVMALYGTLTFHERLRRETYVSQWFILAALLWFPWIFSSAAVLLLIYPVRGMAQAVIAWWYSNNLQMVWLGLVGLAAIHYFTSKLTRANLRSRPLALVTFWLFIICASWCGIPNSAPVPAWVPTISNVFALLLVIPLIALGLNIYGTTRKLFPRAYPSQPSGTGLEGDLPATILFFQSAALLAFLICGALGIQATLRVGWMPDLDLTLFATAKAVLNGYGFFAMAMFGAIYYIVPGLFPGQNLSPKLVRWQFILAVASVAFTVLPYGFGGFCQQMLFQSSKGGFLPVMDNVLIFIRASTLGDFLLLAANALFLANVGGMVFGFYRLRAMTAYQEATAPVSTVGVQP